MSIQRESDGDAMARAMDELAAAGGRHFSGYEMGILREVVSKGTRGLARINTKGLPRAHAREIDEARDAIRRLSAILAAPTPETAAGEGSAAHAAPAGTSC